MKFKVTANHIRLGVRRNPRQCMVALAIMDAGFKSVNVEPMGHMVSITIYNEPRNPMLYRETRTPVYHGAVDHNLWDKVIKWDSGDVVRPFEFEIPELEAPKAEAVTQPTM